MRHFNLAGDTTSELGLDKCTTEKGAVRSPWLLTVIDLSHHSLGCLIRLCLTCRAGEPFAVDLVAASHLVALTPLAAAYAQPPHGDQRHGHAEQHECRVEREKLLFQ